MSSWIGTFHDCFVVSTDRTIYWTESHIYTVWCTRDPQSMVLPCSVDHLNSTDPATCTMNQYVDRYNAICIVYI